MAHDPARIGKHPLVDQLVRLLRHTGQGLAFASDDLATCADAAAALPPPERFALLQELLDLAVFLELEAGAPGAARGIIEGIIVPAAATLRAAADAQGAQERRVEALQREARKLAGAATTPTSGAQGLAPQGQRGGVGLRKRR